jgi:hypothetical protein
LANANEELKQQYASAKDIIDTYVKTDAPYQVNFSAVDVRYTVARGTPGVYFAFSPTDRYNCFERLEREILALLDLNLISLFLQSPECDEYMKRHGGDDIRDIDT